MDNKEVQVMDKKVTKFLATVQDLRVYDDHSMYMAGETRLEIKTLGKELKATKDGIIKPLKESLDNIKALFAPVEEKYERAEKLIANEIISYQNTQIAKRLKIEEEEQKKLDDARIAAEKGKISEKQLEKIEAKVEAKLEKAPEVIKKTDSFHTRSIAKVRITNEKLIPKEFWMIDSVKLNTAVKGGMKIPGAELYYENTLV